jgi:hypothetical protein
MLENRGEVSAAMYVHPTADTVKLPRLEVLRAIRGTLMSQMTQAYRQSEAQALLGHFSGAGASAVKALSIARELYRLTREYDRLLFSE